MNNTVKVAPISRRNHQLFIAIACVAGFIAFLLLLTELKLAGYITLVLAIIFLLFGFAKKWEPEFSMTLNQEQLTWHLKQTDIHIPWDNLKQCCLLKASKGDKLMELQYIGVKLWDLTPIVDQISPRAAKSLYHEYRSLLHVSLLESQSRAESLSYVQEDAEYWTNSRKEKVSGLKGMFAARLNQLKHGLGSDLYIPLTSLDRNEQDFVRMINDYKLQAEATANENQTQ
ncbi:DUF2982 domain-containing protein [Pleionea sp. CnH1-48]|uniref:DUF2982 domain-containing protein n=1 Tax=Pleionea sp. CnH1-48 TaxID=2954494 RepID=UPI0020969C8E|nr:DUF2982 domain-containing protein [Pleionea sp. CnH1-48]MCO7223945.1 DUF2982 domain-containing protein [Pleionea sp. CnH1-48]